LSAAGLLACGVALFSATPITSSLAKAVLTISVLGAGVLAYVALPITSKREPVIKQPLSILPDDIKKRGPTEWPRMDKSPPETAPSDESKDQSSPQAGPVPPQVSLDHSKPPTRPSLKFEPVDGLASIVPRGVDPKTSRMIVAALEPGQQKNA